MTEKKTGAKELRVRARKKSGDISGRPSTIARFELQVTEKIEKFAQMKKNRRKCNADRCKCKRS